MTWRPGERVKIGQDVLECLDVQLHGSHKETNISIHRSVCIQEITLMFKPVLIFFTYHMKQFKHVCIVIEIQITCMLLKSNVQGDVLIEF